MNLQGSNDYSANGDCSRNWSLWNTVTRTNDVDLSGVEREVEKYKNIFV